MARLVALGDAHLGRTHLAHLRDEQGRNVREEDFRRSFSWAVEQTIQEEPDGFLWLGDIFDHARPTYRTFAHVLAGLQRLADAGIPGVAISGNHDTPRVRGTGSPYDALERVFDGVRFVWRMQAETALVAGVRVHAVPQTLSSETFAQELDRASAAAGGDEPDLLIAHVALSSLPARAYPDINEIEVEESQLGRRFDWVILGHYHEFQKVSRRTWYAGSTATFSFADSPQTPKGILVFDSNHGAVTHVGNPDERPLVTSGVEAAGLGPGELIDAVQSATAEVPGGAIVRVFLNNVDASAFRQVGSEMFQEAVPAAIHVQVEPDYVAEALAVQAGPVIGSLEREWAEFVERQDLVGLDRDRVLADGRRFLEEARGEVA